MIYYDHDGQLRVIGAEILDPEINAEAADEDWIKVAWRVGHLGFLVSIHSLRGDRFKLLFGPKRASKLGLHCPLPPNKTKEDVLSDYLQYLYGCSRDFIQDTYPDGVFLWESLHGDAQFILSHPATWGGKQHDMLRKCMVQSGLLPNPHSSRVTFVSEGEANLHYVMRHKHELGLNGDVSCLDTHSLHHRASPHTLCQQSGAGILVLDAGAGTVDIGSYNVTQWSPVTMEEMNIPESTSGPTSRPSPY